MNKIILLVSILWFGGSLAQTNNTIDVSACRTQSDIDMMVSCVKENMKIAVDKAFLDIAEDPLLIAMKSISFRLNYELTETGLIKQTSIVAKDLVKNRLERVFTPEGIPFIKIKDADGNFLRISIAQNFLATYENNDVVIVETKTLVTQEYEFISPILNTCKRKKRDKAKLCTSAKVQRELKYCIDLKRIAKTGIHGVNRAFIQFRVNKTGEIDNVKVRSPHPVISEEIERCFSDMKLLFLPGTTNGVNDSFLFSMPVIFSFE